MVPTISDVQVVLSTRRDHRSIPPRDTGVRQDEASTQTPKIEASIGTGTRDRERKDNPSMRDPGLQGRALVELLKEIILTKVGKRKLYLGQEAILEVGVGLLVYGAMVHIQHQNVKYIGPTPTQVVVSAICYIQPKIVNNPNPKCTRGKWLLMKWLTLS